MSFGNFYVMSHFHSMAVLIVQLINVGSGKLSVAKTTADISGDSLESHPEISNLSHSLLGMNQ